MILSGDSNFNELDIKLYKSLKYSDEFTFIPIKIYNKKLLNLIIQTPLLFTPYGIQKTKNNKDIIDLSFQNKKNDKYVEKLLNNLKYLYNLIKKRYKNKYKINNFLKNTDFDECIRLKVSKDVLLFDDNKNNINIINNYSYGNFIICLEGLWLNNNDIWFQWILLQSRIRIPVYLKEYSFIDEIKTIKKKEDKYEKMIKMGVPKEAVQRQKMLDGHIPPPPPILNISNNNNRFDIPKIKASDLQSVKLKKGKKIDKIKIKEKHNNFEPPSLEELQTTLSKLRKTNLL